MQHDTELLGSNGVAAAIIPPSGPPLPMRGFIANTDGPTMVFAPPYDAPPKAAGALEVPIIDFVSTDPILLGAGAANHGMFLPPPSSWSREPSMETTSSVGDDSEMPPGPPQFGGHRSMSSNPTSELLASIPEIPGPLSSYPSRPPSYIPCSSSYLEDSTPAHLPMLFHRSFSAPPGHHSELLPLASGPALGCAGNGNPFPTFQRSTSYIPMDSARKAEYRRQSISRWLEKRKHRKGGAKPVVQYSERSAVANRRRRVGGRFVKHMTKFVSVTELGKDSVVSHDDGSADSKPDEEEEEEEEEEL